MATEKDYAVLSAYVYNDARGEGNDVILPSTWDELPISASDTTSGFAALFTRGQGNFIGVVTNPNRSG